MTETTTTKRPSRAKKPADHKPTLAERVEAEIDDNELLAGTEDFLKPAHKLRIKERNKVLALVFDMEAMLRDGKDEDKDLEELGEDLKNSIDRDSMMKMLELAGTVDEFVEENLATDKEAYVEWSEGKSHEVFFALLTHYAGLAGE